MAIPRTTTRSQCTTVNRPPKIYVAGTRRGLKAGIEPRTPILPKANNADGHGGLGNDDDNSKRENFVQRTQVTAASSSCWIEHHELTSTSLWRKKTNNMAKLLGNVSNGHLFVVSTPDSEQGFESTIRKLAHRRICIRSRLLLLRNSGSLTAACHGVSFNQNECLGEPPSFVLP